MPTPKNKSVLNAFAVLSAFRATDGWASSGKLSRRANLPEAFREAPMRLRFNYSKGADQCCRRTLFRACAVTHRQM